MKTQVKQSWMFFAIAITLFMTTAFMPGDKIHKAQMDNEYGFLYSHVGLLEDYKTYYICVSDPIKNWNKFSYSEKEALYIKFRTKVNLDAGTNILSNYKQPNFKLKSSINGWASEDECRLGIRNHINEETKIHNDRLKSLPLQVIKIELNLNN